MGLGGLLLSSLQSHICQGSYEYLALLCLNIFETSCDVLRVCFEMRDCKHCFALSSATAVEATIGFTLLYRVTLEHPPLYAGD